MPAPERAIFQINASQQNGQRRAQHGLPGSLDSENERNLLVPPAFSLPDQTWKTGSEAAPGLPFLRLPSRPDARQGENTSQSSRQDRAAPSHPPLSSPPTLAPAASTVASDAPGMQRSGPRQQRERPTGQRRSPVRRKRPWKRVPEMRQMSAVECGACCLAIILTYYGRATSVSEVREQCGVGRDGLSALAIAKTARQYGLRVRAVSLKKQDARFVSLPAIVHWEANHFVVVERWSARSVDIVDPAVGRRRVTRREFSRGFTGLVLMLEPGEQFERRAPARVSSFRVYLRALPHLSRVVVQIVGASLLLQILGLGAPLLTAFVVDRVIPMKNTDLLVLLGIGVLLLLLIQGVTKLLRSALLLSLQTRLDTQMMTGFFRHLLSLPYRFFQMRLNGDLLARVESNTAIRDMLTSQMISTVLDSCTVFLYLIVLLIQSRLIAGIAVAIGAFQVGLLLLTGPVIRRLTTQDLVAQGKTQGYLNEVLTGIAVVKAAGAERRALARWSHLFFDEMSISVRRNYFVSGVSIVFETVQFLAPLLLLWVGATQVMAGSMTTGSMLALNTLAVSFLVPLSSLAANGQNFQIVRAHFERIADVLDSEPEQDVHQVQTPPRLSGNVELRHVSFQYDPQTPPLLNDITLQIQPGQKVALVGKTGSGKSTLGKLLIGLITPTSGEILFDGLALQQLHYQEVRRQFGVVLQDAFLFSGTVRENISLNDPHMEPERIIRAAQAAAIHEDIVQMPMGYETLLSEGGSVFSGGQRQRLALARALANRPALLLLDEATSALDVMTERAVEQNLQRLSCTQIVIAHRLSTIRNADIILVLDQGRIVEQGRHQQLLRRRGFYTRLIEIQIENGEIEVA